MIRLRTLGWVVVAMTVVRCGSSLGLAVHEQPLRRGRRVLGQGREVPADIVAVGLLAVIFATTPTLNERSWRKRRWESGHARLDMASDSWCARGLRQSLSCVHERTYLGCVCSGVAEDLGGQPEPDLMSTPAGTSVYDSNAPDHVMFAVYFAEEARISSLFRPLAAPVAFNGPSERIYIADWGGRLMEAQVEAAAGPAAEASRAWLWIPRRPRSCDTHSSRSRALQLGMGLPVELLQWQPRYRLGEGEHHVSGCPHPEGPSPGAVRAGDSASALVLTGHPDSDPVCVTEVRAGSLKPSDRWIGDVKPR